MLVRSAVVIVALLVAAGAGAAPNHGLAGCTIIGSARADDITGTHGRDVICGLGGNDTILGGGGADVIYGGPGADILTGGVGNDVLRGGAGNDTLRGKDGRRDIVDGGRGSDLAIVDRNLDRLVSIERRRFT